MRKAIEEKKKVVEALREKVTQAKLMVLSDFQGISVAELHNLKKELSAEGAEYLVVKNNLLAKATENYAEEMIKYLTGNTAILLSQQDSLTPLKILLKFFKEWEKGKTKVGIIENSLLGEKELKELAKLPPREILLAKMIGGFQAPLWRLVMVLQGPLRQLVYTLKEIIEKKGR